MPLNATTEVLLAALLMSPAAAQTSHHRADFISASGSAAIAAIDLTPAGQFGLVVDAAENVGVSGAILVAGGGTRQLVSTSFSGPFQADEILGTEEREAVAAGEGYLVLQTAQGPLIQPITDIGTATVGSGGALDGAPPTAAGVGHVMPGGRVTIAVNGATPGRLGAFAFSAEAGGGEWAPGIPKAIGTTMGSDLRIVNASGRLEWSGAVPVTTLPGAQLHVQYLEFEGATLVASSPGVRVEVRPSAGLVVDRTPDRIELRTLNGIVLTSANLTDTGEADPVSQTFAGVDTNELTPSTMPSAILAHPAFSDMVAPLQSGDPNALIAMDSAELAQRLTGGGMQELLGIWGLGWEVDGCTMVRWRTPFEDCCNNHDLLYGVGGTEADRLAADIALAECVLARTGNPYTSKIVYDAVREHGGRFFNYTGPAFPIF